MDTSDIHQFCIDWQLGIVSRDWLRTEFNTRKYDFSDFKKRAMILECWTPSMAVLEFYRAN